jgi:hypothetical protein
MTSTRTRHGSSRYVVCVAGVLVACVAGGWSGATDAPAGARGAARDYLDHALERNEREPGFFRDHFGVDAPREDSVSLGDAYPLFVLTRGELMLFAMADRGDLLEFADTMGFGFPLMSGGRTIGAVTSGRAPENMYKIARSDSTVAASLERNGGWMWNSLLNADDPTLMGLREVREHRDLGDSKADFATLLVQSQGWFLLAVEGNRIVQIASTNPHTWLFDGVTRDGEPPPFEFTDYAATEPTMRANARREFDIDEGKRSGKRSR